MSVSVCLFGPESTGKTTLARALADHYGTFFVPEYGRYYCETFGNECDADDLRAIVRGQNQLVAAAKRKLKGNLLILDTDPVMTALWTEILLGARLPDLDRVDDPANLYLLAQVDVPFAKDAIRYFPDQAERERFFERCRAELERRKLKYVVLEGAHEARLRFAVAAIDVLLKKNET